MTVDQDVVDQARIALRKAVDTLNACIDKIVAVIAADKEKDEYDRDLVVHLAWLTHQVIQILAELKMLDQVPTSRGAKAASSLVDMFK